MTTDFHNVMFDVECLGVEADAALVSIGGVFFDYQNCVLGPTFSQTIHLGTAVRDGGKIEAGAVLFWLGQSQQARDGIRFGGRDIKVVLQELSDWIKETCRHEDVRPWGNSAGFDLTKIDRACGRSGIKTPWHWSKETCFRTVRNMHPKVVYDPGEKGLDAHTALADAIFQTEHLFKVRRSLRRG